MKKTLLIISLLSVIYACQEGPESQKVTEEDKEAITQPPVDEPVYAFTEDIESAHRKKAFLEKEAISYDLEVRFNDNKILEGSMLQRTDGTKIRLEKEDGTQIIFNDGAVYMSPSDAQDPMARFHVLTWSYFLTAPYKFNDPGTQWSEEQELLWDGSLLPSAKLEFKAGTGDAPDDWYVVYKDPSNGQLEGMAYIVSYGKSIEEAEEEPHAIHYQDYTEVEGIPIAMRWTFHEWTEENGLGAQIGEVILKDLKFTSITKNAFARSPDAKDVELPE